MKRMKGAGLLACLLLCLAARACAQGVDMQVYVAKDAMERETALHLAALLERAYPQATWTVALEEEMGESLRERVMADDAPQLAICAPQTARMWAKEGLLAVLDGQVSDAGRIAPRVLEACTQSGSVFMLPLEARHRRMAVNRTLVERRRLGHLLGTTEHPVWHPSELYQILEECALAEQPALELWPVQDGENTALVAMIQALYAGELMTLDGACHADSEAVIDGLTWVRDMAAGGLITYAQSREEALAHFLSGETALFLDMTDEEERVYAGQLRELDTMTVPYPCSAGVTVRAFDVVGVSVFAGEDEQQRALAMQAAAFLHEDAQAQRILGERGIWADEALWLPSLEASDAGSTLSSLFAEAIAGVLERGEAPEAALHTVQAAMESLQ